MLSLSNSEAGQEAGLFVGSASGLPLAVLGVVLD